MKLTPLAPFALVGAALVCLPSCAANDGMRVQVISMTDPPEELGARPPPDYTPCYTGEARAIDTDGDGKADRVRVSIQGRDRCYGEDTNHNGKIDTWDVVDDAGRLTKRAHDSNDDGRVDQAWTFDPSRSGCATIAPDADSDGKPDPGSMVDICQQLSAPQAAPAATPVTAPAPPPKPSDHH